MEPFTLKERAEFYNRAWPQFPDSHLHGSDRWISGTWIFGNDYRGSGYYGSYPPAYLRRVSSLFPDAQVVLHLFSGSVTKPNETVNGRQITTTLDIRRTERVRPSVQGDAQRLPFSSGTFDLIVADTPYTDTDAAKYNTKMPVRQIVFEEMHRVLQPGGIVMWMDIMLPMFAKVNWNWCIAISCWRSTNHRVRGVAGFQRV